MGRQVIRNPEAFAKSQAKKRRSFAYKVAAATRSIPETLVCHFNGKLDRCSLDMAIDELIAKGAGGTPRSMRTIARALKHQQHADEPGLLHDRNYAAKVIATALTELESKEVLTVTKSKQRVVIVIRKTIAANSGNHTPLVIAANDCEPVEPDDTYDPHRFVRHGPAKANSLVFE